MALLFLATANVFAASFNATLDRTTITVGESVTLSLTYDGVANAETPQLPPLPNLNATSAGQSSQFVFNNGQQSAQVTYTYQLTATQPGDVVIPSVQGRAGGAVFSTRPLALKILPPDPSLQAALTNLAFLRLLVPKREMYVGEAIAIEVQLLWRNGNAQDLRIPQLKADGFTLGAMPQQPPRSRTQLGNAVFEVATFRLTATALRAGALTLGPAESTLTYLIPRPGARPNIFGQVEGTTQAGTATSEAVAVRVLPLPRENVPPGFSGAIGTYNMSVTAGPTNLTVGDPITVRVQIAGSGPIESLQFPAQTDWRDFTTYPATSKTALSDALGLAGSKSFEQVIIPQNHEIKALPSLRFSFFDPAAKAYRTLSGPEIPLGIRPAGVAAAPPPTLTNTTAAPPPADDIVHIRPRLDAGGSVPLLAMQPWFLGAQGVPILLWLALLIHRKRAESLANNPRLRRQREVAARVRDLLKELRAHASAQKSAEFFAALFRVLQEQLGERLDLPASAITEAVIDERLRNRGLSDDVMRSLHELFQTCNAARYAPVHSSEELSALIPKLEGVLRALQGMKA
jgi:hypothetical protein